MKIRRINNMWLLVLILSIKLQMPTAYWIIFTIITIFRPVIWVLKYNFVAGYMEAKSEDNK